MTKVLSIAAQAYVYAYPIVVMELTRRVQTGVPAPAGTKAPSGQFAHLAAFPDASFEGVVSPNADTLYSSAFLDLAAEPIVLSVPDTKGRYYLMPMLDAWTNVFASPGARTTGTKAGDFAITGPHWSGGLPDGLQHLEAPTSMVWIVGRTQTNGKSDYDFVHSLQAEYRLTPLSAWGTDYVPPATSPVDTSVDIETAPVDQAAKMPAEIFWTTFAGLLKDNPPALADAPMVETLAALGIDAGKSLDWSGLSADLQKELTDGAAEGLEFVESLGTTPPVEIKNTWAMAYELGSYGTNYPLRAAVAWVGLGANLPQDAIYPLTRVDGEGKPLTGKNDYVMHFDKGQIPPVGAFWSITMYNNRQFFVDNPIDRYAIGDRDALKYNEDGSLDILIQHDSPGKDLESNWLPAPADDFNLIFRLYWPKEPVLDGTWVPPVVSRK